VEEKQEENDNVEDFMDMIEEDDMNFLKTAISNKSYDLTKGINFIGYDFIWSEKNIISHDISF